jgi:hypothetical protein
MEKFKNTQSFQQKYYNDPHKIAKYRSERDKKYKNLINNVFVSTDRIQTNRLDMIPKNILSTTKPNVTKQPTNLNDQIKSEIYDPELEQIFNEIDKGTYKPNKKNSVQFDPVVKNPENKYKLYHDSLFREKQSEKLIDAKRPLIDQTISQNIMAYMNDGIETIYSDNIDVNNIEIDDFNHINNLNHPKNSNYLNNPHDEIDKNNINFNTKKMRGKTIKEIYDDITNDGRLNLQQNLDDLEANDKGTQFIIGEKYGATRFDTYSVR